MITPLIDNHNQFVRIIVTIIKFCRVNAKIKASRKTRQDFVPS